MTWKNKFLAWVLVGLSYLCTFVTPMIAAYYLLAEDVESAEGKGGLLFYIIIGIFGGALVIAVMKVINKQKASVFKTIFRLLVKLVGVFGLITLCKYIDFNIDHLIYVFYWALGGFGVGAIFEAISILKYQEYIREQGVF
jgi:uncharacterized membrane protein YeaQ/YmgE (transglycosylase-associated protein family)